MKAARDGSRVLDLCERAWAPKLRGRALVAEAEPELQADLLPAVSTALVGHGPRAVRQWPACLLMAVVGQVATDYKRGSAWAAWWRAQGRRTPSATGYAAWQRAFRDAATEFSLAVFAGLGGDEALLAHTGIPDAFLDELCSVLSRGDTGGGPASVPVTLLLERPEAAAFLDRCRQAWTAIGDGGAGEPRVPQRFADAMAGFRARRAHERLTSADALTIEPFGRGPLRVGADGSAIPVAPDSLSRGLFVFGQDGAVVPDSVALPAGTEWLLYPADAPPETGGVLPLITQGSLPIRWAGWTLIEADLSDVAWLRGGEPGAVRRIVSNRGRPVLMTGPPVEGMSDSTGRPVHAALPVLRLPAGDGDWSVEVRDRDGGVLARERVRGERDAAMETSVFWQGVPRPLLGEYTVRAGAVGAPGLVRTVVLAEGLAIARYPDVRLLQPEGLEPAEVVCHTVSGMTAVPMALTLARNRASHPVELLTRYHREPFVVKPPRMRVHVEDGAYDADTVCPPRLDVPDVARGGRLSVEVPGLERSPTLEVLSDGCVVQTVLPHRDGTYNLRRVLDTAASHPDTVLRLVHAGRTATVAWIVDRALSQDPWLPRTQVSG